MRSAKAGTEMEKICGNDEEVLEGIREYTGKDIPRRRRQTVWFPDKEAPVKEGGETSAPRQTAQPRAAQGPRDHRGYPKSPRQNMVKYTG